MIHINVFVDGAHPRKDGTMSVKLRVTGNDGRRFFVDTGLVTSHRFTGRSFPSEEKKSGVKTSRLNVLFDRAEEYCLRHAEMSTDELSEALRGIVGNEQPKQELLTDWIREFSTLKGNVRTRKLYEGTLGKVESFDRLATLETVDRKWLTSFDNKLAKTMSVNGRSVHMRNLRSVFNYAIDEDATRNYPFRKFSIRREQTAKRSLSARQLRAIRDIKCEPWQEPFRDMFMLMFYLIGINAADLFSLRKDALRNGRITYHRAKTNRLYSVKVYPQAIRLIEKWGGREYLLYPLESYKNYLDYLHHMNNALKKLGMDCSPGRKPSGKAIEPNLTSYWARHTWASLAADLDIPVDVIGHALGHSDKRVTDIYIKFNEKKVDDANLKVIKSLG